MPKAVFICSLGMCLCHHSHVISQYPNIYDGVALHRTHFGKPSILCIRVFTFVEFLSSKSRRPYTWSKYRLPKAYIYLLFRNVLCHHPHVIGQYPNMYDGAALRRTHFGKPSVLCMRVSTFVEF